MVAVYRETMDLVKAQSTITTIDGIQCATLKPEASWEPFTRIQGFSCLEPGERSLWELCAILFEQSGDAHERAENFKRWLRNETNEDAKVAMESLRQNQVDDPYAEVFVALSFGRISDAASAATRLGDHRLALSISCFHTYPAIRKAIGEQIVKNKQEFDSYSNYQQRIWCMLSGKLGFEKGPGINVTHGLSWKQALSIYVNFGNAHPYGDPLKSSIGRYLDVLDDTLPIPLYVHCAMHTEKPPKDPGTWYNLLKWWWYRQQVTATRKHEANKYKVDITNWPPRLAWRFAMAFPDTYSAECRVSLTKTLCRRLSRAGLIEYSEFLALFNAPFNQH